MQWLFKKYLLTIKMIHDETEISIFMIDILMRFKKMTILMLSLVMEAIQR